MFTCSTSFLIDDTDEVVELCSIWFSANMSSLRYSGSGEVAMLVCVMVLVAEIIGAVSAEELCDDEAADVDGEG